MHRLILLAMALQFVMGHSPRASAQTPPVQSVRFGNPLEPNLNFDIQDEASYQKFLNAIRMAEFVRVDYALDERPSLVAALAGLHAFVARNPEATAQQINNFWILYTTDLLKFQRIDLDPTITGTDLFNTDPYLMSGSTLLAAIRGVQSIERISLFDDGTDTRVADDVLSLLGLDIPEPINFIGLEQSTGFYENARWVSFANSSVLTDLLVIGFMDRDIHGNHVPGLAQEVESLVSWYPYDPTPPLPLETRYQEVGDALANLPANCFEFHTQLEEFEASPNPVDPMNPAPLYSEISSAILDVTALNDELVSEITDIVTMSPTTLLEAAQNADTPALVAAADAAFRADLLRAARSRTAVNANALLIFQGPDGPGINTATLARDFSGAQIQYAEDNSNLKSIIGLVGAGAGVAGGVASKNPADVVSGLADMALIYIDIHERTGENPPPPEDQIFNQITAVRTQLNSVQIQLNERFNAIEAQLGIVYDGIEGLIDEVGTVGFAVDALAASAAQDRETLSRIEDALWAGSSDLFEAEIAEAANAVFDFRTDNSIDLPYAIMGMTTFIDSQSGFFTDATTVAENVTFAGDEELSSTFSLANAGSRLSSAPFGRNINDLRVLPASAGLGDGVPLQRDQFLAGVDARIVAPGPWAQACAAWMQVALESPWYLRVRQQGSTELDTLIAYGEELTATMASARSQTLFDDLFAEYNAIIDGLDTAERTAFVVVDQMGGNDITFDTTTSEMQPQLPGQLHALLGPVPALDGIDPGQFNNWPMGNDADTWRLFSPTSMGVPGNNNGEILTALALRDYISNGNSTSTFVTNTNFEIEILDGFITSSGARRFGITLTFNGRTDPNDISTSFVCFRQVLAEFTRNGVPQTFDAVPSATPGEELQATILVTNPEIWRAIRGTSDPADQANLLTPALSLTNGEDLTGQTIRAQTDSGDTWEMSITSSDTIFRFNDQDVNNSGFLGGFFPLYESNFNTYREAVWATIRDAARRTGTTACTTLPCLAVDYEDDTTVVELNDIVALLDAYTSMGMPRFMEASTIARSAFRGPESPDNLSLRLDVYDFYRRNANDPANAVPILEYLGDRVQRVQDEINGGIMNPQPQHGYLEWVLAGLRALRENSDRLAVPDTYIAQGTDPLVKPEAEGLLANDVGQAFRVITVDFDSIVDSTDTPVPPVLLMDDRRLYVLPEGDLVLDADARGGFEFTPTGLDDEAVFSYRSTIDTSLQVGNLFPNASFPTTQTLENFVSAPATVVIRVENTFSDIRNVPSDDYPTIQSAISTSSSTPRVLILVAPGTHEGFCHSWDTSATVRAVDGPHNTFMVPRITNRQTIDLKNSPVREITVEGFTFEDTGQGMSSLPFGDSVILMRASDSTLNVINCVFKDNDATPIYSTARGQTINIRDCHFEGNTSTRGGAVFLEDETGSLSPFTPLERQIVTIENCLFKNNSAVADVSLGLSGTGGAIHARFSEITLADCVFEGNTAEGDGGAIYFITSPLLDIKRCVFRDQMATTVFDPADGGAVYVNAVDETAVVSISNSLFANNFAQRRGGAITVFNAPHSVSSCTFADNTAGTGQNSEHIHLSSLSQPASLFAINSIFWRSTPTADSLIGAGGGAPIDIRWSRLESTMAGQDGNVTMDPLFEDLIDFRLSSMSPLIDAGNSAACGGALLDLVGDPRIVDDPGTMDTGFGTPTIDMGAYEYIDDMPVNSCASDFDNDGDVDLTDFGTFGAAFGSMTGDANYDPDADFDIDGDVDLTDFGTFGSEFGFADCLDG